MFLQYCNQNNGLAGIIIIACHYTQFQTCAIKKMNIEMLFLKPRRILPWGNWNTVRRWWWTNTAGQ